MVWLFRHKNSNLLKISKGSVLYCLFTFCPTTGDTIYLAWCGFFGTFLSIANTWTLNGLFPGGVSVDSPWYVSTACTVDGILFIFIMLWLNWDMNTRVFAIASFIHHWMRFVDPTP